MTYGPFEGETLLDLSVNVVPLVMLVVFLLLFVVGDAWGHNPFAVAVTVLLHVVPIVSLALVSYVSGLVVQRDEG